MNDNWKPQREEIYVVFPLHHQHNQWFHSLCTLLVQIPCICYVLSVRLTWISWTLDLLPIYDHLVCKSSLAWPIGKCLSPGWFLLLIGILWYVFSSLGKNAYDHITATYYLLAERLLRKQQEAHKQSYHQATSPEVSSSTKPQLLPLNLSPRYVLKACPVPTHSHPSRLE